jgi:hypothetical protein
MPAASPDGAAGNWLMLTYHLPARPASLRATVRRKLTAAGAVYLSAACAAAPWSGPAERVMRRMRATITSAGGSAVLLGGRALVGEPELAGAFNAVRDREYEDIIACCRDAAAGVEAMIAACEFSYLQLWSGDIAFRRLSARCQAVRDRDLFGARQAQAAESALAGYRSALDEYAARVHAVNSRS